MSSRMRSIGSVLVNQLVNMRTGRRRKREAGRDNDPDIDLKALVLPHFDPVSRNHDVVVGKFNDIKSCLPQLFGEERRAN